MERIPNRNGQRRPKVPGRDIPGEEDQGIIGSRNRSIRTPGNSTPNSTNGTPLKKKIHFALWLIVPVLLTAAVSIYLGLTGNSGAKAQQTEKDMSQGILSELNKEQEILEKEKKRLEDYERSLKLFEQELDQKYNDFLLKEKNLKTREDAFNKKIEDRLVDRQTIETYENIDPEQAAILMKNLYEKDKSLATLIMRKISGKKAGKILEAMIPIDKETSTLLAKETLDFYKNQ